MNRSGRMPVMAGFAVMVIVTLITGAARADRFDNIEIAVRPLADGLSMLQGAGGNVVACAAAEGVVLIDSDCAGMSEKLHAAVAGLESGAVRLVVNTHWHFDHVEGNSALKEQGAVVIAHSATRAHMSAPQHFDVPDHDTEAAPESQLPDICLEDGMDLYWGGREIRIRHVADAHTDTDLWVHFPGDNVVHTGDIFFNGGYPFIDTAHGGSIDGIIAAGEMILAFCDERTQIVPGHGPLAGRSDLEAYLEALRGFSAIIKEQIAEGSSLEEIVAAGKTAAIDADWGTKMYPPGDFTEMVWLSVLNGTEK